jgi:hypothetical protein
VVKAAGILAPSRAEIAARDGGFEVVRDGGIAVHGGVEEEFIGGKVIRASDDELIGGKVTQPASI